MDLDRHRFQTLLAGLGITLTAAGVGRATGAGRVESFLLTPKRLGAEQRPPAGDPVSGRPAGGGR